jgi:hypothetical protein
MRQAGEGQLRDIGNVIVVEVAAAALGQHRSDPETSTEPGKVCAKR